MSTAKEDQLSPGCIHSNQVSWFLILILTGFTIQNHNWSSWGHMPDHLYFTKGPWIGMSKLRLHRVGEIQFPKRESGHYLVGKKNMCSITPTIPPKSNVHQLPKGLCKGYAFFLTWPLFLLQVLFKYQFLKEYSLIILSKVPLLLATTYASHQLPAYHIA